MNPTEPLDTPALLAIHVRIRAGYLCLEEITPNLNRIIPDGEYQNQSVAFWLAVTREGQALLCANNNALGSQITAATLNAIIPAGKLAGMSVAFWLAVTREGHALLLANNNNNNALGSQITAATLNAIIPAGQLAGTSVALELSRYQEGQDLLCANNNALGSQITAATLNAIITAGQLAGTSVALGLARTQEGQDLLCANNNALGSQITAATLNAIITAGQLAGTSVALELLRYQEGLTLLCANNNALGSQITAATLNAIIPAGQHAEESVIYWLCMFQDGLTLLRANNYALSSLINAAVLNAVIHNVYDDEEDEFHHGVTTLAKVLSNTTAGQQILDAHNFRLVRAADQSSMTAIKDDRLLFDILDGKTNYNNLQLEFRHDDPRHVTHREFDTLIRRNTIPHVKYALLCALYNHTDKPDHEVVNACYLQALKQLLKLNFAPKGAPSINLVRVVAHKLPCFEIFDMFIQEGQIALILNISRHLVDNINAKNVEDIFWLLNTINAHLTNIVDASIETELTEQFALFLANEHAGSIRARQQNYRQEEEGGKTPGPLMFAMQVVTTLDSVVNSAVEMAEDDFANDEPASVKRARHGYNNN